MKTNKCKFKDNLIALLEECKKDNWDGYGAESISEESFQYALKFLDILNKNLTESELERIEVVPENLGNFCFDYFVNHDKQMSMSIIDNKIIWNWWFNDEKENGRDSLNSPDRPIKLLKEMLRGEENGKR